MKNIHIDEGILNLQKKIGLKTDFFKKLLEEDDWSFVIKLHALIEAILTSLLVFHFNEKNLLNIFSRLELSNKTVGKLAFLKETGLLTEHDIKYIYNLSELRNKLVHNVENCNINLKDWINKLDRNQLKNFAVFMRPSEAFTRDILNSELGDKIDSERKRQCEVGNLIGFALENPKLHIWIGAYSLLVTVSDNYYFSDYLQSEKAKELLNNDRKIFE